MTNSKPTMLHSNRGSVFSVFSEEESGYMWESKQQWNS